LELLTMVVPPSSPIGLLGNPDNPSYFSVLKNVQDAALKANIPLIPKETRSDQDIENAFTEFATQRVGGVLLVMDSLFTGRRQHVAQLALRYRLPTMFPLREFVEEGGLMSYGESLREFWRRSATFVHKVMHGAKPADLPMEQPMRFHLTINRKTADALGVTIPSVLYIFADEIIE
jgi:putative ABC transport system substrate-binding protein